MNRRRALVLLLSALGGWWRRAPAVASTDVLAHASAGLAVAPAADVEVIVALGEAVVDGGSLSAEARRHLAARVVASLEPAVTRRAAAVLDRLAGGSFTALGVERRRTLVAESGLAVRSPVAPAASAAMEDIRSRVLPALIEAHWRSPAGWQAVGYRQWPGVCGDLERYTRPES